MAPDNAAHRVAIKRNCPHCQSPIDLLEGGPEDEVLCPSCGSSFKLDPDRTQIWSKDKLPVLGKFELIEILGRGAFGTVYRARDTQLQRVVAVKVPRSGQLTTAEDEDRFVREARNVAQLQHPGIVPVYEVGRSEAFSFIVSELVEGITLADALSARRFGFRELARLVSQIAAALEHAHAHGVVHRDLKPSNIMLAADGIPRVMDFGLAKRDAGEVTVTLEGQVLGTPAYMSPEQASGYAHHVDGRSDVYSLGSILYELLTGELPFRGNQRMLLHQVLHDEPRAPRSLNDRIPRDLETICLRAMAKEPARRYQTSQQMADDLTRFLAGEAITARPVRRVERAWRWCKRQPVVASLAAAVALALVIGTSISTYFAIQSDARAREAILERERANENADKEQLARQAAELNLTEATRQRERAETAFREAREAVDKYYTSVSESKLLNVPGLQPLRTELLETALEYYQKFINEYSDDPKTQAELASTYDRVGRIRKASGSRRESTDAYKKAIEILEKLVQENPHVRNYQESLAWTFSNLGRVQTEEYVERWNTFSDRKRALEITAGLSEAETSYKKAIEIFENLLRTTPAAAGYQYGLSTCYADLGELNSAFRRPDMAVVSFKRALEIQETLVRENPAVVDYQDQLARTYAKLGREFPSTSKGRAQAQILLRKAVEIREKILRENPTVIDYRDRLGTSYYNLGKVESEAGNLPQAEERLQYAIDIFDKLVVENPTIVEYRVNLSDSVIQLGDVLGMSKKWKDSAAMYAKAVRIVDDNAGTMFRLALTQLAAGDQTGYRATCAALIARYGANAASVDAYNIALVCVVGEHAVEDMDFVVTLAERAVEAIPFNPIYRTVLGAAQLRAGRSAEARVTLERALPVYAVVKVAAPNFASGVHANQLLGEVFLAFCYPEEREKRAGQIAKARELIAKMETRPIELGQVMMPWAIPFAVEVANRELARLNAADEAK